MNFKLTSIDLQRESGCLVLGTGESGQLSGAALAVDSATGGAIGRVMENGDFKGEFQQTLLIHSPPGIAAARLLLVGFGKEEDYTGIRYRSAISKAFDTLTGTGTEDCAVFLAEMKPPDRDAPWLVRQIVEAARYAAYRSDHMKSRWNPPKLDSVFIHLPEGLDRDAAERAAREGMAIADGVWLARELGDLPGNVCTPTYLAEQAMALAGEFDSLNTVILEEEEMEKLGMGAFMAVARGSREPAKLIVMEYNGLTGNGENPNKPVVLVGKGITFDSGGISLKPGSAMDEMKFDMCGAASVFGAVRAALDLSLPIHLVGIVPATENLPGGNAVKPGDIVKSLSEQTVEILNTDAEGRLILCDALTFAGRYDPDVVIDIATLTGACRIALGAHASGLLGNYDPLIAKLGGAGQHSADRVWPLPLWEEYQDQIKSNFADMANIGGRLAGTITAACFLSRFTRDYHWAHLDIAGVSSHSGKKKGATGRPVALLVQYLLDRVSRSG